MHGLKKKMHIKISKKGKTMRRILGIIKRIKKAVPHRPGKQRKVRKNGQGRKDQTCRLR